MLLSKIKAFTKELNYKKHPISDVRVSAEKNEMHDKTQLNILISQTKRSICDLGKK